MVARGHVASAEASAYILVGVWGQHLQRGPATELRVGGHGANRPP